MVWWFCSLVVHWFGCLVVGGSVVECLVVLWFGGFVVGGSVVECLVI